MAVEHVKSTPITNLGLTPVPADTTGRGAGGVLRNVSASLTLLASSSQDSTYRFVKVPTTAKVKSVKIGSEAQAGGTLDVGVYYPTVGKTAVADLAANAIDQDFFASAYAVTNRSNLTDVTFEAGAGYLQSEINLPLWQALGLTSDPGGWFEIAATVVAAITTGGAAAVLSVDYVD